MPSLVQNVFPALSSVGDHESQRRFRNEKRNMARRDAVESHASDQNQTVFSVKALILFLEDQLELRLSPLKNAVQNTPSYTSWMNVNHSNNNGLYALKVAQAYAHTAQAGGQNAGVLKPQSSSPDLKKIYDLILRLRHLSDGGVHYIKVSTDMVLLDAIFGAIQTLESSKD